MSEIILYDIPSKDPCAAWSPNTWKTRLILNYKSLPYKTHWLEYPSIAPHLTSLSISPNNPSTTKTPYTLPTITLPDGKTHIMDSALIAPLLEERYPNPPLHLSSPQQIKLEQHILPSLRPHLIGFTLPKAPRNILNEESCVYYNEKWAKVLGMSLQQFEQENSGDEKWDAMRPLFAEVGQMLKEDSSGPFFQGKEVSYADFVLAGWLVYLRRLGEGMFERVVGMEPGLGRLWEACEGLVERDD